MVNSATLEEVSNSSMFPFGQGWDVDFICLDILPQAIHVFVDWWGLGGSATRALKDPFPIGFELCTAWPFTMRVQLLGSPSDDQVAAWGLQFIMVLKALSPTHNPTLVPSSDIAKAALQLSTETRLRDLQFQMLCSILVWVCTNSSLQGMA